MQLSFTYIMDDECKTINYITYVHACIATYMHMDVFLQLCAEPSSVSNSIHNHAYMYVYYMIQKYYTEMSEIRLRYMPV